MFENSGLVSALNNIKKSLLSNLIDKYNIDNQDVVDEILKTHGLHKSNFDFINNIETIISNDLNAVSIDDNANKNEKTIAGLTYEVTSPVNKIVGYRYLYRKLVDLFGKDEAKRLTGEMYDYSLMIHDSSKLLLNYCYALDASKLVTIGRDFGVLPSLPPKRLSSYISALNETVHQISNHLAGACLSGEQEIIIKNEKNEIISLPIKKFINEFVLCNNYNNYQGDWEYKDISQNNFSVLENKGDFVKINKVMRRKYNEDIFVIKTKSGKIVKTSKDHIFKVLYKGREISVPANELKVYDTVFNTSVNDIPIDKDSYDYELGQLHGIIAGDGCITSEYSLRIAINYEQKYIVEFLDRILLKVYGKKGSLDNGHKCYDYRLHSVDVVSDLVNNVFCGENDCLNKKINIDDKTINYLIGFLDGILVTDGAYSHNISLSLINKNLIDNVVNILKQIYIHIQNISVKIDKRKGNRKPLYHIGIPLRIIKYLKLMKIKVDSNKKYLNNNINEIAYYGHMAFSHSSMNTANKIQSYKKIDIENGHSPNTDVIIEIYQEINKDNYVYEIETATNWYSAGGILTHNCAIGSFFLDAAHILIYKENKTLEQIKNNIEIRKYIENCFQNFVHSVNHLSRAGAESPFTNISFFDRIKIKHFISEDNMGWYFSGQIKKENNEIVIDNKEYIIEYILELQRIFTEFFVKGDPAQNGMPYRFPVYSANISKKIKQDRTIELEDKKFIDELSNYDISRFNILVSEGSRVSSCCRLLSDADTLALGNQVNSFGGGGLSLGSHRVVTINYNRIALEAKSYDDYKLILDKRIEDSIKILKAHKELIYDLEKAGLQQFITNGWINMRNMFSTVGILGIVEANETIKDKFNVKEDVVMYSLKRTNEESIRIGKEYKLIVNQEQVPGESGAVRLAKVDALIFGKDKIKYPLYSNQFIPLWEDASIWERMEKDGKYNLLMTGGGIVHFNLGSRITKTQTKKLIEHAIKTGSEHFALNGLYCQCKNGHTHFGDQKVCPECGAEIVERLTRVVGFFTPVSSWNPTRQKFDFPKRIFNGVD